MYYGIDLGTTNSLIGTGEKLLTGLVSSSVNIDTKSQCERDLYGTNIVSSYKVNMTTGSNGALPVACSAVILRELANRATVVSGDNVQDVVISVPAKFTHTQREAVCNAGKAAGLNVVGLINEPTAAAIYVCRDVKDLIVVYDLGGGTFDVTVIDSRAGSYYVVASKGEILAGDDFDRALVELAYKECGVKIRFKTAELKLKIVSDMRLLKEQIQKSGETQYMDMSPYGVNGTWELTVEKYVNVMKQTFASTISLTKNLIAMNVPATEHPKIVFVGGSTACPYLRRWVKEETGLDEYECNATPDYIVAKGVALYAEMLFTGAAEQEVDDVTRRICIEDAKGMSITIIDENTTIPIEEEITLYNPVDCEVLEINLYQGDAIFCKDNAYIGTLMYNYGEFKKAGEGYVNVIVSVNRDGMITLTGIDLLTQRSQNIRLVMR